MSQLLINGIDIPVSSSSWEEENNEIGERQRSLSGSVIDTIRARFDSWKGESITTDPVQARALRGLLNGSGHGWSFDVDLYSTKGLGPEAGHNGAVSASSPKYGAKRLEVTTSGSIAWNLGITASIAWTVSLWRIESSVWHHYVINYMGQKWKDGARNDGLSVTFIAVNSTVSGCVVLNGGGSAAEYYDDLIVVPYTMPTDWPGIIYAYGQAWPKPPALWVSGTLIHDTLTLICSGRAAQSKSQNRGALDRMEKTDFTLTENIPSGGT